MTVDTVDSCFDAFFQHCKWNTLHSLLRVRFSGLILLVLKAASSGTSKWDERRYTKELKNVKGIGTLWVCYVNLCKQSEEKLWLIYNLSLELRPIRKVSFHSHVAVFTWKLRVLKWTLQCMLYAIGIILVWNHSSFKIANYSLEICTYRLIINL